VHAGGADTGATSPTSSRARTRASPDPLSRASASRRSPRSRARRRASHRRLRGALGADHEPRGAGGTASCCAAAGAALADLELVQFHPTALRDDNGHDGFLLSEALRGAGATLLDDGGERFVDELAPRDVVARAIAARPGLASICARSSATGIPL
jgi:hypothetical protein